MWCTEAHYPSIYELRRGHICVVLNIVLKRTNIIRTYNKIIQKINQSNSIILVFNLNNYVKNFQNEIEI